MSFLCKIGLHSWNGCICSKCKKIRDEKHDWIGCKCKNCESIRDEKHDWSKDCQKCSICGKTRIKEHDWSKDCQKCSKCSITSEKQHDRSKDCTKCSLCGKSSELQHSWNGCKCSKCGKERKHIWDIINDESKCKLCGEVSTDLIYTDERDGNVYKCVKIGNQIWMAENLRYKASTGCWVYGNNYSNVEQIGYLYNFETAKKVCPVGWHLPSNEEWTILTDYLGGEEVACDKLISDTYAEGEVNTYNSSGFSALLGGFRIETDSHKSFCDINQGGWWRTSTECSVDGAWTRQIYYGFSKFSLSKNNTFSFKAYGFSVRCLKN